MNIFPSILVLALSLVMAACSSIEVEFNTQSKAETLFMDSTGLAKKVDKAETICYNRTLRAGRDGQEVVPSEYYAQCMFEQGVVW